MMTPRVLLKQIMLVAMGLVLSNLAFAATTGEAAVAKNVEPVGQVKLADNSVSTAAATTATSNATDASSTSTADSSAEGKKIYDSKCAICHAAGVAGAPKFQNQTDWAPRVEKGMPTLLASAIKGINAMPPKGTCMDCTDAQIKAAILYMLPADLVKKAAE